MPLKKAYGRNQNANVFDERFPHTEAPRHTFAIQDRLNGVCFSPFLTRLKRFSTFRLFSITGLHNGMHLEALINVVCIKN